jgi:phenylpropionate dioxygenase-like ring-hydroxylating dioxygenase large terminal subunit
MYLHFFLLSISWLLIHAQPNGKQTTKFIKAIPEKFLTRNLREWEATGKTECDDELAPGKTHSDGMYDCGPSWYLSVDSVACTATSFLSGQGNNAYHPAFAHDLLLTTAWVEGKPDYGIGEKLTFSFRSSNQDGFASGFYILNGYAKSPQNWQANSRVKKMRLYVNDQLLAIVELLDLRAFQKVDFGKVKVSDKKTTRFTLEIMEVYPGTKYKDTAITDVEFFGNSVN